MAFSNNLCCMQRQVYEQGGDIVVKVADLGFMVRLDPSTGTTYLGDWMCANPSLALTSAHMALCCSCSLAPIRLAQHLWTCPTQACMQV